MKNKICRHQSTNFDKFVYIWVQCPQNFRLRRSKIPIENKNTRISAPAAGLLRRRRKFSGFRALLRGFYLTKWRPQAKILQFQSTTKVILPYKMGAAGENFAVSDRCKRKIVDSSLIVDRDSESYTIVD